MQFVYCSSNIMSEKIKICKIPLLLFIKVLYNELYNCQRIPKNNREEDSVMSMNKVRLRIYGSDYFLTTDDDIQYMRNLGDEVDFVLSSLLREHPRLSITQAAVLCALQMADEKHKTEKNSTTLRSEIQAYMEDASKAKTEAEIAKREIDRLNKEIRNLKNNRHE